MMSKLYLAYLAYFADVWWVRFACRNWQHQLQGGRRPAKRQDGAKNVVERQMHDNQPKAHVSTSQDPFH